MTKKMNSKKRLLMSLMVGGFMASGLTLASGTAKAGGSDFLGEVTLVGFNFCPRGTIEAAGQLLPINNFQALFSLYGTSYGGDGRTTFAVPDLRGRLPIGLGQGAGLTHRKLGQRGGAENHTLTVGEMASHSHAVRANNLDGDKPGPGRKLLAAAPTGGSGNETIYSLSPPNVTMNPAMIGNAGGGLPISVQDPYLAMRFCINSSGVFPSRN